MFQQNILQNMLDVIILVDFSDLPFFRDSDPDQLCLTVSMVVLCQ
jgi:hypothetical protein